jgi:glycosyltransferase involved in cell wall biosynthesis
MTVLQILPELDTGGVERGTLEIGSSLVRNGHRSLVVSAGGKLVGQLEAEGSRHLHMAVGNKSLSTFKYILPLRRLMLEEKVDILHLRSRMPAWIAYLAWKSLPASQRPALVTTFHGFYSVNGYSGIMAKGQTVIAVSGAIAAHIAEKYGRTEGVTTIHRGVDVGVFNPELVGRERIDHLQRIWELVPDVPVIMLPGRFTSWKGHAVLLKALVMMGNPAVQVVFVGDQRESESYTEELLQIMRNSGLLGKVKMVGRCQDMAAAYLLADLVVSASSGRPEAFGRVSAEAMAMGRPVVATAHGGSLEIVEDGQTGWLVPPSDEKAMAQAIAAALSLPAEQRQAVGERGRRRVLSHFTTETMCRRTLEVYDRLQATKR